MTIIKICEAKIEKNSRTSCNVYSCVNAHVVVVYVGGGTERGTQQITVRLCYAHAKRLQLSLSDATAKFADKRATS